MRIAVTAVAVCLSIVGLSVAQDARAAFKKEFTNIPAQGLGPALQTLAQQREFQVVYLSDNVDSLRTAGAVGEMTSDEALTQLLSGTGLTYRYLEDNTVTIYPLASSANAGGDQAPGTGEGGAAQRGVRELRLAQNDSQGPQDSDTSKEEENKNSPANPDKDSAGPLEEIVVTGTHIRGAGSGASPIVVLDRDYIVKSGFSTVNQLFEKVPQNFAGSAGEDDAFGIASTDNFTYGSGVDLRGLGADSTLVLLNGRRMAPAGSGGFVDISAVPLAALDRVEILTDGASAIYGADAIAGVVNFILLKDYDGAATNLRVGTLTNGDGDEVQASQLFGRRWSRGSALLSYEYYRREPLAAIDRDFVANADKRPQGGDDFRISSCFPGTIRLFDGRTFGIPAGQDGTALTESQLFAEQPNLCSPAVGQSLLPRQERHSMFLSTSAELTDTISFYLDGLYSRRESQLRVSAQALTLFVPESNAFRTENNLFPGEFFVPVEYSMAGELGVPTQNTSAEAHNVAAGFNLRMRHDWTADAGISTGSNIDTNVQSDVVDATAMAAALASDDPATAFNPFGALPSNPAALLTAIAGDVRTKSVGRVDTAHLLIQGPTFSLPGGVSRVAIGTEYRDESFVFLPKQSRNVASFFAEASLPIAASRRQAGMPSLELSLAGRVEDYSDFGDAEVGKVGLLWRALPSIAFRGTYGTSFKAPLLRELHAQSQLFTTFLPGLFDPRTDDVLVPALLRFGGNRNLTPEEGTTFTLGVTYRPERIPRGKLDFTYVNTSIEDRIASVENIFTIFANEDVLAAAGAFSRDPPQELIDALVANSDRIDIFGPPLEEGSIAVAIDTGLRNLGKVNLRALDLDMGFGLSTAVGDLDFILSASYLLDLQEALVRGAPLQQRNDTFANPTDLRIRAGATWSRAGWSLSGFANFADGYKDEHLAGQAREIDSWTTVDMTLAYAFRDLKASLSVGNLLDEEPPFVNIGTGYDAANADPSGRSVSLTLSKSWQ